LLSKTPARVLDAIQPLQFLRRSTQQQRQHICQSFLPFSAFTHLSRSRSPLPRTRCRLQSNRCKSLASASAPPCAASTPCRHSFALRCQENPSSSCHSQRPAEQHPCRHDTACAKEVKKLATRVTPDHQNPSEIFRESSRILKKVEEARFFVKKVLVQTFPTILALTGAQRLYGSAGRSKL
jgi:hypothetical protein